ncbi:hypothetical protein [Crocinitomix algicola]|uniref:hypothetical protein n=1 Tax=Crocinitomix algicola TaxID=1740263 RepID=UPI000830B67D|nr:hypothetical protein [Crocinitomix algicola]
MSEKVQNNLRLAVEQLFVKVHGDLISEIREKHTSCIVEFNEFDIRHKSIITLGKEKIGFKNTMSNGEIFNAIIRMYDTWKEREAIKLMNAV